VPEKRLKIYISLLKPESAKLSGLLIYAKAQIPDCVIKWDFIFCRFRSKTFINPSKPVVKILLGYPLGYFAFKIFEILPLWAFPCLFY